MKKCLALAALLTFTFCLAQPVFSQSADELTTIREDVKSLKEGQIAIQKDLQEIKKLLASRPAAQPAAFKETVINVQDAPFKGDKNAEFALIEFSDFQCPFCGRHVRETFPGIEKKYVSTGKVKYFFKDFPLESIHKNAFNAAEAANCAAEQGKFWEMHDELFANQKALGPKDLVKYAETLKLDMSKFNACLDGGKYADKIKKDMAEAQKAGISSTPTFLLGFIESDGKVKAVKMLKGAQGLSAFEAAIDDLISLKK